MGTFFYVYGGAIPRRNPQFDWTNPIDGSDPATEWQGFLSLDELPQLEDPDAGYVQNSNSSPFVTTDNEGPDESSFGKELFRYGREWDQAIARRSRQILSTEEGISFERWSELAFDTYLQDADKHIEQLRAEMKKLSTTTPERTARFEEPLALLERWNRRSETNSIATTVYVSMLETESKDAQYPMLDRLEQAMNRLQRNHGRWQVPFGAINRLDRPNVVAEPDNQYRGEDLASAGLPFQTGAIFTFNTISPDDSKTRYGYHGHSFVSVIEFGDTVRAASVMAFGQSRDPESPHYFDQAPLYAEGRFKPAWFDLADIRNRATRTYHPGDE